MGMMEGVRVSRKTLTSDPGMGGAPAAVQKPVIDPAVPANPVDAVLVPVSPWQEGLAWYERAFPEAKRVERPEQDFAYLDINGMHLEVVEADDKVSSGAAGSVVYWHTEDFDARLAFLLALGATLYRGPMAIADNQVMCQVKDPWGNCIGIRGAVDS